MEMDEKLLDKYADIFGESFPTYQVAITRSDAEVAEIIKECIEKNRTAYQLGYCTDDDDVLY
jgi:hypothetical protein